MMKSAKRAVWRKRNKSRPEALSYPWETQSTNRDVDQFDHRLLAQTRESKLSGNNPSKETYIDERRVIEKHVGVPQERTVFRENPCYLVAMVRIPFSPFDLTVL